MDPIGIAGLAIAVFDQILRLGERTTQTIQDVRAFAEDLKDVSETIRREHEITKALKFLLFEESPRYGGQTLFDQYGEETQKTILSVAEDLVDTMESASKLLDRHSGSEQSWFSRDGRLASYRSSSPLSSTWTVDNVSSQSSLLNPEWTSSSTSLAKKLLWSMSDKKRAKDIIDRYAKQNGHLSRMVQLNSFASEIGVNLQHLEHMKQNVAAKRLGFDETANLQLLAKAATAGMAANFEMSDDLTNGVMDLKRVEDRFFTFSNGGKLYLLDTCEYKVRDTEGIDHQTRSRLNGLASLLQQPKGLVFRIPKCIGWRFLPSSQGDLLAQLSHREPGFNYYESSRDIAFIFESPGLPGTHPRSLLRLFEDPCSKPSLQDKLALAHSLAKSISQLQMVQWVHESFRSENILFFVPQNTQSPRGQSGTEVLVPLHEPWIFGFDFSRPERFFSHGFTDVNHDRDVYRHPDRQGHPTATFSKWHDIYSLGVVLLEIGLWEPAIKQEHPSDRFRDMEDPRRIKDRLLKVARKRLPGRVGGKYTDLVVACLMGDFRVKDDTREDIQLQQAFRAQVVEVLARSLESI